LERLNSEEGGSGCYSTSRWATVARRTMVPLPNI
jgi:hypothetical protein